MDFQNASQTEQNHRPGETSWGAVIRSKLTDVGRTSRMFGSSQRRGRAECNFLCWHRDRRRHHWRIGSRQSQMDCARHQAIQAAGASSALRSILEACGCIRDIREIGEWKGRIWRIRTPVELGHGRQSTNFMCQTEARPTEKIFADVSMLTNGWSHASEAPGKLLAG